MRVRIEIEPELTEDEVIIRCRQVEEHILRLQQIAVDTGPGVCSAEIPNIMSRWQGSCFLKRKGSRYRPIRPISFI